MAMAMVGVVKAAAVLGAQGAVGAMATAVRAATVEEERAAAVRAMAERAAEAAGATV